MNPNKSKYIHYTNMKHNLPKQAFKNHGYVIAQRVSSNKNIAQDYTHAEVTSPS